MPVEKALKRLGADIRVARIRRRWTVRPVAERSFVSMATVARVERGDAAVSLGIYATVLFVLGLHEGIGTLAAPERDDVGVALMREGMPKRVRASRRKDLWT
ncbi:MAG: helix-turn-helix domain-containing protein [Hyphomicrobiaceae bacterium]